MKKYIFACLLLVVSLYRTPATLADMQVPPVQTAVLSGQTNKQIVQTLVHKYSVKYGVSESTMMRVINCEDGSYNFTQQSGMTYKAGNRWGFAAGTREKSFGLVQIHIVDNPVTYEQAIDPEFAVNFLAENLSHGRGHMWTCY